MPISPGVGATSAQMTNWQTSGGQNDRVHPVQPFRRLRLAFLHSACAVGVLLIVGALLASGEPASGSPSDLRGSIPLSGISKLTCSSTGRCLAVGLVNSLTGGIALTTNAGTTWSLVAQDPVDALSGTVFYDISCKASLCAALGQQPDKETGPRGLIYVSHDAGLTWTPATSGASSLYGVSCSSAFLCSAVGATIYGGTRGQIAVDTADGGTTWTGSPLPKNVGSLTSLACTNRGICLAIGRQESFVSLPVLLRSSTDGQSWTKESVYVQHLGALASVDCSDDASCIIVGSDGSSASHLATLISSKDAGRTWSPDTLPRSAFDVAGVSCAGRSRCVAIAQRVVGRSPVGLPIFTEGSNHWRVGSVPPSTDALGAVSCATTELCFASAKDEQQGNDIVLLRSTDGGKEWSS